MTQTLQHPHGSGFTKVEDISEDVVSFPKGMPQLRRGDCISLSEASLTVGADEVLETTLDQVDFTGEKCGFTRAYVTDSVVRLGGGMSDYDASSWRSAFPPERTDRKTLIFEKHNTEDV